MDEILELFRPFPVLLAAHCNFPVLFSSIELNGTFIHSSATLSPSIKPTNISYIIFELLHPGCGKLRHAGAQKTFIFTKIRAFLLQMKLTS